MKKIFTICAAFILGNCGAQTYSWAITDNTYPVSNGAALAIDGNNNLFVAETFTPSAGKPGIHILKYDVNHNQIWKRTIEATSIIMNLAMECDKQGNVVLTGSFGDTLIVNGTTYTTTCKNCPLMFVVKYDASGNYQWLRKTSGNTSSGRDISTDSQNNVYVSGNVYGNTSFDTISVNYVYIHHYIAKYDANGNIQWLKGPMNGTGVSYGVGLKTDANDETYLAGTFYTKMEFGTYTINATGGVDEDIYIAKINSSGQWLWAKKAGGMQQDALYDLDLDVNGNPYITGSYGSSTASFGTVSITNTGQDDYYLTKYDTNGNALWATGGGGSGSQFGTAVCVDNQGIVYLARTGTFFSRFNSSGAYLNSDFTSAWNIDMVRTNTGCVYFTGSIGSAVSFGSYNLTPSQTQQMYIAEYCSSTSAGIEEKEIENSFSVHPNPATGKLTITCKNSQSRSCVISIKNSLGQVIYTESVKDAPGAFTKQIDLSTTPKGIYFVELQNIWTDPSQEQNAREIKKIVLQ